MFNIDTTPFSRRGSYFAISKIDNALYIRDVHGGDQGRGCVCKIEMLDARENPLCYTAVLEAHQLCLHHGQARLVFIIPSPNVLRVQGADCTLRLRYVLAEYDHVNKLSEELFELHSYSCEMKMQLKILQGLGEERIVWESAKKTRCVLDLSADGVGAARDFDAVLQRYAVVPECNFEQGNFEQSNNFEQGNFEHARPAPFESERQSVREEYERWVGACAAQVLVQQNTSMPGACMKEALYVLWASLVKASGILPYETMYMSKHAMTNAWSWDHCFVAMALCVSQPQLAYEQYLLFKKFQHSSGALPDYVNDVFASYACVKPPIHGWAYRYMMQQSEYFVHEQRLLDVYDMLVKMNDYWLQWRMRERPLPYYNHGNDSGWDNATVFARGCPVIAPDLTSYIILNCEAAADIARRIGKNAEARVWSEKAQGLLNTLLSYLYDGAEFYTRLYANEERVESTSLINCMPLVLGDLLPSAAFKPLVQRFSSAEYLTEWGVATEALSSGLYRDAGYWRGPVWPMTTMLIVDGLQRGGEGVLAQELARRFLRLVEHGGMCENFDAKRGVGLEDSAFSCTASVYVLLLARYGDLQETEDL